VAEDTGVPDTTNWSQWTYANALAAVTGDSLDDLRSKLKGVQWLQFKKDAAGQPPSGDNVAGYHIFGKQVFAASLNKDAWQAFEDLLTETWVVFEDLAKGVRGALDKHTLLYLQHEISELGQFLAQQAGDYRRRANNLKSSASDFKGKAAAVIQEKLDHYADMLEYWHHQVDHNNGLPLAQAAADALHELDRFIFTMIDAWSSYGDGQLGEYIRRMVYSVYDYMVASGIVSGTPNYKFDDTHHDFDGNGASMEVGMEKAEVEAYVDNVMKAYPYGDLRSEATWQAMNRDISAAVVARLDEVDGVARKALPPLSDAYVTLGKALSPLGNPPPFRPQAGANGLNGSPFGFNMPSFNMPGFDMPGFNGSSPGFDSLNGLSGGGPNGALVGGLLNGMPLGTGAGPLAGLGGEPLGLNGEPLVAGAGPVAGLNGMPLGPVGTRQTGLNGDLLGPNGELLGPNGTPLTGPNGELLGPGGALLGPGGRPLTGPRGELLDRNGEPLLGPNGELLGPDGGPLTGPNGELLGPDGGPLTGPNGELLAPGGGPLTGPNGELLGPGGGPLTGPNGELLGPNGEPLLGADGKPLMAGGGHQPPISAPPTGRFLALDSPPKITLPGGGAPSGLPAQSPFTLSDLPPPPKLPPSGAGGGVGTGLDLPGGSGGGPGGGPGGPGGGLGSPAVAGLADSSWPAGGVPPAPVAAGPPAEAGGPPTDAAGPGGSPTMPMGGMGGMPYMPGMGGGAGAGDKKERERQTWLSEDEKVWGTDVTASLGVIGRPEDDEEEIDTEELALPLGPVRSRRPAPGRPHAPASSERPEGEQDETVTRRT